MYKYIVWRYFFYKFRMLLLVYVPLSSGIVSHYINLSNII